MISLKQLANPFSLDVLKHILKTDYSVADYYLNFEKYHAYALGNMMAVLCYNYINGDNFLVVLDGNESRVGKICTTNATDLEQFVAAALISAQEF